MIFPCHSAICADSTVVNGKSLTWRYVIKTVILETLDWYCSCQGSDVSHGVVSLDIEGALCSDISDMGAENPLYVISKVLNNWRAWQGGAGQNCQVCCFKTVAAKTQLRSSWKLLCGQVLASSGSSRCNNIIRGLVRAGGLPCRPLFRDAGPKTAPGLGTT